MNKRIIDLIGQKFGRLAVLKFVYTKKGHAFFLCQCSCGRKHITRGTRLRNEGVKSCGKCIHPLGYKMHNFQHYQFPH